jgi:hypothetical protein
MGSISEGDVLAWIALWSCTDRTAPWVFASTIGSHIKPSLSVGFSKVNAPIILAYAGFLNVGISSSMLTYFVIGTMSQYWLRRWKLDCSFMSMLCCCALKGNDLRLRRPTGQCCVDFGKCESCRAGGAAPVSFLRAFLAIGVTPNAWLASSPHAHRYSTRITAARRERQVPSCSAVKANE